MTANATDSAVLDRVIATVYATPVSREVVDYEWPECHKRNCQAQHGSPEAAYGHMKAALSAALRAELSLRATSRPDVAEDGDSPSDVALYTLAWLLATYKPERTSTYVEAARLILDAYPNMIPALSEEYTA